MKIYYLYFFTLLFLVSCNSDSIESEIEAPLLSKESSTFLDSPINTNNPFDYAGQLHNELLTAHYSLFYQPSTLDSIIEVVRYQTQRHPLLMHDTIGSIYASQIQYIIDQPDEAFHTQLSLSSLSAGAQIDFAHFISTLVSQIEMDESYPNLYHFITAYESEIVSDVALSPDEKSKILKVTSIIRHSIYLNKKRPKKNTDPDWDWLTTSIYGATTGTSSTLSTAIANSLITGSVLNR